MPRKKLTGETPFVDPDDAPFLTREMAAEMSVYEGEKLIRRGRPQSSNRKKLVSLRLDPDVLEKFRATGPGWQSRINETLRRAVDLRGR